MMQSDAGKLHLDQCAPLLDVLLDAKDDTALAKVVLSFLWIHEVVRPSASACSGDGRRFASAVRCNGFSRSRRGARPSASTVRAPYSQCSRSRTH